MILTCPACATRYEVPDGAIPAEGRTVRCAKCRHSWFEAGAGQAPKETLPAEPPPAAAPEPDSREPAPAPPPRETASEKPEAAAIEEDREPTDQAEPALRDDDAPSPFEHQPPFRRRRNSLRLLTYAGVVFATVAAGLIAAVSYFGLPDWVPVNRPTFALGQEDLQLDFPPDQQERRQLPNGAEFFGASGTVTNTGSTARTVPPILIVLRDARDRIVYSWEVYPPKRTLAPGEAIAINEAVTDVPRSARVAEIGWKPE